jgi:Astacin (Peptidase family M12A)/Divergent InlB B-repeat domain
MWNNTTGPAITVVPRTTESNYVNFVRWSNSGVCSSWEGMVGGAQTIYVGDYCSAGDLAHEIGHAVGLLHEHSRVDRDTYVTINWGNIISTYTSDFQIPTYGTDMGSFDYNSIMMYPAWAFSSNGQPTITTIPAGIPIGQRAGLSPGDIAGAEQMYGVAPPAPNVTVTLATNPANLTVSVNGASYAAPAAVTTPAGTVYSISTPNPQSSGPVWHRFSNWSNGSPRSFTLTVPTSPLTLTANFTMRFVVIATAGTGGTVSLSPAAAHNSYPANSIVTFTATASTGYCFASWTGLDPGTPSTASVTLTAPITATANFTTCEN